MKVAKKSCHPAGLHATLYGIVGHTLILQKYIKFTRRPTDCT